MTSMETERPTRRRTTWELARLAGCGEPDKADSARVEGDEIPETWPVQPLDPTVYGLDLGSPVAECGTCHLRWDDGKVTAYTPAPAGRCPFEQFHGVDGDAGSAGAVFLRSVENAVLEMVEEHGRPCGESGADRWLILGGPGGENPVDLIAEIADAAPDVSTYTRWLEFVDLAAWQEEPEVGFIAQENGEADLTAAAGVALYMIAERLAWALLEELAEEAEEAGEEDDETDPPWIGFSMGHVVTITMPDGSEIRGKVETYDSDEIHVESMEEDGYGHKRMMLFTRDEVESIA